MFMNYQTTKVLNETRHRAMKRSFTPSPRKSPELAKSPAPKVRLRPIPAR